MNDALTVGYGLTDEAFNASAIGRVKLRDDGVPLDQRQGTEACRKKLRMADRAIEVDQQTADGGAHPPALEGSGQGSGQGQGAGIVTAMRVEPCLLFCKIWAIGRRNAIATVFAGKEKDVRHGSFQRSKSGR